VAGGGADLQPMQKGPRDQQIEKTEDQTHRLSERANKLTDGEGSWRTDSQSNRKRATEGQQMRRHIEVEQTHNLHIHIDGQEELSK